MERINNIKGEEEEEDYSNLKNSNNDIGIILDNEPKHHHDSDDDSPSSSNLINEKEVLHKDKVKDHGHAHGGEKKKKKHGHSHGSSSSSGDHGHSHSHSDEESNKKLGLFNFDKKKKARVSLLIALVLTTIFMVGEVVGGYMANSLAIMTDAAHLLTDIGAMLLSLFAMWISTHPPTSSMSFGFHRAEILGALASVLMIWALTGVLIYEGIQRVLYPPKLVDGKVMFIIACGGLLINIIDAFILHWGSGGHGHSHGLGGGHSHDTKKQKKKNRVHFTDNDIEDLNQDKQVEHKEVENINVRSAYIHVLGDCLQSIGVMIASAIIWIKPSWKIADPITTFIFSLIVLVTTIRLLKQSLGVLMEGVPNEINSSDVQDDLSELVGVVEVHDLHIWSITVGRPALSVHLSIAEGIDPDQILQNANKLLASEHNITHTTIQIEKPKSGDSSFCKDNSCPPPPFKLTPRNRNINNNNNGSILPEH